MATKTKTTPKKKATPKATGSNGEPMVNVQLTSGEGQGNESVHQDATGK